MLLAICIVFLLKKYSAQAITVSASSDIVTGTIFYARDDSSNADGCGLGFLWSRFATTSACTRVSVHPNVPFKGEGKWKILKRRFFLMFFSILAPEVMIMWAFKQWRGAVMIKNVINDALPKSHAPWTTTHVHFLQMGGFRVFFTAREQYFRKEDGISCTPQYRVGDDLVVPRFISRPTDGVRHEMHHRAQSARPRYLWTSRLGGPGSISEEEVSKIDFGHDIWESVLTLEAFKSYLSENLVALPTITKDEITDRSKGDALSKGFAFPQLVWFIMQIISRATKGSATTELELTTAALAGLNSIMYVFWWSKSLNVRFPVVVRTTGAEELLKKDPNDLNWTFTHPEFSLRQLLRKSMVAYMCNIVYVIVSFLRNSPYKLSRALQNLARMMCDLLGRLVQSLARLRQALSKYLKIRHQGNHLDQAASTFTAIQQSRQVPTPFNAVPTDIMGCKSNRDSVPSYRRFHRTIANYIKATLRYFMFPFSLVIHTLNVLLVIPITQILPSRFWPGQGLRTVFNTDGVTATMAAMFYSEEANAKPLLCSSSIAGAFFGAVHCLAWHFVFPSPVEQAIWRTASLCVVGACAWVFVSTLVNSLLRTAGMIARDRFEMLILPLFGSYFFLCYMAVLLYPTARITLLVLAVTCLRSLPSSAFDTVRWIEIVPHI